MKKLLILAIIVFIGYLGYKKTVGFIFSDKGLAESIASGNKDRPKTIANGVILEKMETEPGLRIIQRVTLPAPASQIDSSRISRFSEFACKDSVGRYMLDHGVTMKFVVQDNEGETVKEEEIKKTDC